MIVGNKLFLLFYAHNTFVCKTLDCCTQNYNHHFMINLANRKKVEFLPGSVLVLFVEKYDVIC